MRGGAGGQGAQEGDDQDDGGEGRHDEPAHSFPGVLIGEDRGGGSCQK